MDAYLVRVWRPSDTTNPAGLRGTVVDLASHTDLTFHDTASLLAILTQSDPCIEADDAGAGGAR